MTEQTLSEKRGIINLDEDKKPMWAYHEKDIKEAVKKLINEFGDFNEIEYFASNVIKWRIEAIFGKELTE